MHDKTVATSNRKLNILGMKRDILFPLITTSIVVMIGWYVNGCLASKREQNSKKRELTVQYLIQAYHRIETVCGRAPKKGITKEMIEGLESAIADIQLFGSTKQIELARKVVKDIEGSSFTDPRYLLVELRKNLSEELNLEPASTDSTDIMHFRVKETP